jgi:FtsH-binding integral membrane protein
MTRERVLRVVLVAVGLIFVAFAYALTQPKESEVLQMFMGVYATLGVFLLIASRNPSANRSLIAFTAWSSLVHAAIMAVQSIHDAMERGHLLGGVGLFVVVGMLLMVLAPRHDLIAARS